MNIFRRSRFSNWYYRMRYRVRRHPWRWGGIVGGTLILIYFFIFSAPFSFPVGAYINIPSGSTLEETGVILHDRGIIRSQTIFEIIGWLLGTQRHMVAGEYFFPIKETLLTVVERIGKGDHQVAPAKVLVPEGATVSDIGKLLAADVPGFDLASFTIETRGKEGYLFPDTYFFMPGQGTEAILGAFANNFASHIAKIQPQITAFGKPLSDVIIMASLLEREAPDTADRRVIAGILWKRISLGMPLQVDAVFPYIIGKNSFDLTKADLQYDSPYNTYTHIGLPPGPIANPGQDAILDAVTPTATNYLYYLSDKQGNFHFSTTYDQHLAARDKYLGY